MIIAFAGRKQSGKTTSSDFVKNIFENRGLGIARQYNFADPLKTDICMNIFDYNRPTNNKRPDTLTVTAGGTQIYNTVLPTWSSSATESDISFDVAEDIIIAAGESTIINLTASNATGANAAAQFDNIALVGEFEE